MKGWKTIFQANVLKKQAGVAILISKKINFQPKVIKKDKEGHLILIKGKAKYTVNKTKRPPTDWERIFTYPKADRGLISDKIDFQPKVIKKDKEGHFILIKGKILQGDSLIE